MPSMTAQLVIPEIDRTTAGVKWTWACRVIDQEVYGVDPTVEPLPVAGDVAAFRVADLGYHTAVVGEDNKKLRVYSEDIVVGVFGNRYATEAFEGEVEGTDDLSLLTAGGLVGTVKSRHRKVGRPTALVFQGFLVDPTGRHVNLKRARFRQAMPRRGLKNLFLVVGTAMNTGKTTCASKLVHGLARQGLRVAACKLTGSVSNRDQDEMRAAAAQFVVDFSDYGFPSTYLCSSAELRDLFLTASADLERAAADVTVMEVADGVLQRETAMLLADPDVRSMASGVVLSADSPAAALYAVDVVRRQGYPLVAVSGALTSAPLLVREFRQCSDVPVASSADDGRALVALVADLLERP